MRVDFRAVQADEGCELSRFARYQWWKSAVITFRLMAVDVIHDIQANESQLFKYVLFFYRFMPLKRLLKTVKIEKINRPRGSKILVFQLENSIFCAKTHLFNT